MGTNTAICTVLWQVLEDLGVSGRVLSIVTLCMHRTAQLSKVSAGLSEILSWLLGVKQVCPLSLTLFGLYVNGFDRHLLQTAVIAALH